MKPLLNISESVPHEGCKGLPTHLSEELCGESVHIILGQNFSTQKKKKRGMQMLPSLLFTATR